MGGSERCAPAHRYPTSGRTTERSMAPELAIDKACAPNCCFTCSDWRRADSLARSASTRVADTRFDRVVQLTEEGLLNVERLGLRAEGGEVGVKSRQRGRDRRPKPSTRHRRWRCRGQRSRRRALGRPCRDGSRSRQRSGSWRRPPPPGAAAHAEAVAVEGFEISIASSEGGCDVEVARGAPGDFAGVFIERTLDDAAGFGPDAASGSRRWIQQGRIRC